MKLINRAPGAHGHYSGGVMKRLFVSGKAHCTYFTRMVMISGLFAALCAGCTRFELEDKAGAYNQAIGESNNRQILANAVRASQRGPMSFVGFGEMAATPTFNGTATGSWMFDAIGTVTGSTLGTNVSAGGGFNNFQLSNLNTAEFLGALQTQIKPSVVQHFIDLNYPPELIILVLVQKYELPSSQYFKIVHDAESRCAHSPSNEFCQRIAQDQAASVERRCPDLKPSPTITIPNTARHFCDMNRFQTFVRQLILLNITYKVRPVPRTPEGMLYWLGELVAAQNYSANPYIPEIFADTHTPLGHKLVPLFEVWRGPPLLPPAVAIVHQGELFYIPRPAFGTIDEARSLQVLDLVWYAMALSTKKGDLPRSTTVTLSPVR